MHGKNHSTQSFSHLASIAVLMLMFGLIISTVIFVTFFVLGVNLAKGGLSSPLSVTAAYCNSTGVFATIRNNLDSNMSVSYVKMGNYNSTILLLSLSNSPVLIAAGGEHTFSSDLYVCPTFESLNDINISTIFASEVNIKHSFNNIYLLSGNVRGNMTSSTVIG